MIIASVRHKTKTGHFFPMNYIWLAMHYSLVVVESREKGKTYLIAAVHVI